jgi:UDP-glucose 4-epimerase
MKKTKIAITGSNGFIGSHLVRLLAKNDRYDVVPFVGDLLNKEDIKKFFNKNKNIDQIVHLVGLFDGNFDDLIKVNVVALANLLEQAVANKVKKIIFSSTGAVYGEPIDHDSRENDPLNPNSPYGLIKKYAEECIQYYSHNFGLKYTILRFPNIYGKGNNKGVIYCFVSDIKEKGEITIYGDGTQSRHFLHVSDACLAIEKAIDYQKSGMFNISNPKKISINDIVEILQRNYKFKIRHLPANNNLKDLLLNVDKALTELKFEAKVKELIIL